MPGCSGLPDFASAKAHQVKGGGADAAPPWWSADRQMAGEQDLDGVLC